MCIHGLPVDWLWALLQICCCCFLGLESDFHVLLKFTTNKKKRYICLCDASAAWSCPFFGRIFSPMFHKWTLKNIWHMIIFCILCKCFKVGFVFAHHFLSVRLSVRHTGCVCVLNSSNFKTIMPKSFTSLDALLLLLLLPLVLVRLTVYMFDRLSVRPSVNLNVLSLFYICNSSNVFATSFYVTSKMVVTNCYLVFSPLPFIMRHE